MEHVVEDLELVRKVLQRSGGSVPGRGHSTCTGPGCLGNRGESCVAGAEGGAEPCGGQGRLWLLAQGGLWAEELRDLTQVLTSTLAAVEGIDGGDTQGEQVTALVWMDDSWTKVITMEGASEKWAGLG